MKRLCLAAVPCVIGAIAALAGSAVPPWSIHEYELINDIPGGMTPICMVRVWDVFRAPLIWTNPHDPSVVMTLEAGTAYGTCVLQFTNKARPDFTLILPAPEKFHALGQGGGPLDIIYAYDDKHHSSDRLWLGMFIKPHPTDPSQSLKKGDTSFLISNGGRDGGVYVDARPARIVGGSKEGSYDEAAHVDRDTRREPSVNR